MLHYQFPVVFLVRSITSLQLLPFSLPLHYFPFPSLSIFFNCFYLEQQLQCKHLPHSLLVSLGLPLFLSLLSFSYLRKRVAKGEPTVPTQPGVGEQPGIIFTLSGTDLWETVPGGQGTALGGGNRTGLLSRVGR